MTPYTERDIWKLDQMINARGVPVDIELARRNIEIFRYLEKQSNERVREVTGGLISSASQVAKLRQFINENFPNRKEFIPGQTGEPLKNLQAATLDAILAKDDVHPDLRTLLEARKISGKTSVKKYQAMLNTHVNVRVYDTSRYHTAHTGRHGGTRLQPLNMFRPKWKHSTITGRLIPSILALKEIQRLKIVGNMASIQRELDPRGIDQLTPFFWDLKNLRLDKDTLVTDEIGNFSDALSSMTRATLKAPEGKKFIAADYVGIETCVIMWLAGEKDALAMLNRGESLYKWMAGMIYNKSADDIIKGSTEYQLGKISILALVYGMGQQKKHPTFSDTCKDWGIECDFKTGQHIVYDVFREQFSGIVQYWRDIEAAFKESLTQRKNVVFKNLEFQYEGGGEFLFLKLPSGRRIAYNKPEMRKVSKTFTDEVTGKEYKRESWQITYMGPHPKTKKWVRLSTWGGKTTENADQAIASCLLRGGMINAEVANYPIILSVYDEILTEVDLDFGSVGEFEKIITQKPDWAKGCPFNAEGWEGERYRK